MFVVITLRSRFTLIAFDILLLTHIVTPFTFPFVHIRLVLPVTLRLRYIIFVYVIPVCYLFWLFTDLGCLIVVNVTVRVVVTVVVGSHSYPTVDLLRVTRDFRVTVYVPILLHSCRAVTLRLGWLYTLRLPVAHVDVALLCPHTTRLLLLRFTAFVAIYLLLLRYVTHCG